MIRTAILSFWHVHAMGYVKQVNDHPDIELVAAWDEDPVRGRERTSQLNLSFVEDLDDLFTRPDIDAVIVQAPTSLHHNIITRAAKAGKHIFSDKVLAPTIREANEIVAAADAAKVVLVVGMPHLYYDFTLALKSVLDSGKIGALVNARMMNCHGMAIENTLPPGFYSAKEACGGALIDMCHIVYITPLFFGTLPKTAFARFAHITKREVEDSAVVIYDFADGSHATLETTFATRGAPRMEIELNGTEGTVIFRADSHPGGAGAPRDSSMLLRVGDKEEFAAFQIGMPAPSPIALWAKHILDGTRPDDNIARALDLSRLTEAAYLSAAQDRPVALSSLKE